MDKRSLRRSHYLRLKKRRAKYVYWYHEPTETRLNITVNTPTRCSCPMCGNARKWWKDVTKEEKSLADDFKQQMDDLLND